jgi:hypothetical protein
MNMQMRTLNLSLAEYGPNKGRYTGNMHFAGEYGGVEIVLSPDMSDAVLKICAEALVQNAKDVAQNLTAQLITQSGLQIEDKS